MLVAPITPNQLQILRALLAKKGWSEAYFAWKVQRPLMDLTTKQARDWIHRLTKETAGKPRATTLLEPPAPADPPPAAPNIPPPAPSSPPADLAAAATTMMTQLDLVGEPARQTILHTLAQVGVQAGFAAVMLALAAQQQPSRLTILEQWVVCCRQVGPASAPPESTP